MKNNLVFTSILFALTLSTYAQTAIISGTIELPHTGNSLGVSEAVIVLESEQVGYPKISDVDNDGAFSFDENAIGENYTVSVRSTSAYLNGVSTLDQVLIIRHLLNIENLDSPFKILSADINNDKKISLVDLIEVRKLILGIYTELPQNSSWKYIIPGANMTVTDPWDFTEALEIQNLGADVSDITFIANKVGDVNDSAQ